MNKTEQLSTKDKFDYVMKHFTLIADQRVKTFNFYVVASAAAVSASAAIASRAEIPRITLCIVGTAHVFIALVFWLIDLRGCRILRISSDALAELERIHIDGLHERLINEDKERNRSGFSRLVSYRWCFLAIFVVHASFGVLFAWHPDWLLSKTPNQTLQPTAAAGRG